MTKMESQNHSQELSNPDEWYELLPIEKKLIAITLGLGIVLLIVFILSFRVL